MLYVIYKNYFAADLLFHNFRQENVELIETNSLWDYRNKFVRSILLVFFLFFPRIAKVNYDFVIRDFLKKVKSDDTILIWDDLTIPLIWGLKKYISKQQMVVWIWNPIGKSKKKQIKIGMLKKISRVYTFDKIDAKKFNLYYKNQVYSPQKINKQEICFDIYFVGLDKKRYDTINSLENECNKYNLKCKFCIVKDKTSLASHKFCGSISNEENLINIGRSKCLLDLVQEDQSGLTLRVLEALFYGKKLITNNKYIREYDFYNKNNIFIIGVDNMQELHFFIEQPFLAIEPKILNEYEIGTWIKSFKCL